MRTALMSSWFCGHPHVGNDGAELLRQARLVHGGTALAFYMGCHRYKCGHCQYTPVPPTPVTTAFQG